MERRTFFPGWLLPALLVTPQLALTIVFFLWPAGQAIWTSATRSDPFGIHTSFVGLENFVDLFTDPLYVASIGRSAFFCAAVAAISLSAAMTFAVAADREIRFRGLYRVMLIWPYAIAPAVAAVLWILVLHPNIGLVGRWLNSVGIHWDYKLNDYQAMFVVVLASAWKEISYNFIFLLAGLQSISRSVTEAARMDGAKGFFRFRTVTLPLLMPTVFFLLVVNLVYGAFDTFGTIWAMTSGGPGKATETLVVKVYRD
ncbi:MAG: ABC transporter permease subunit, partial [Bryobacteraceae bacterium]|nr:ABC transporter permease subunit [Bryobacteraceae bacterium]